uniref:Uncharacterized protein n=1 Tax=Magallana gigas TaxID=29159 RepID=A0A8W8NZW3_MAGGI
MLKIAHLCIQKKLSGRSLDGIKRDCRKIHETKRLTQGHVIILLSDYVADPVGCHQEEEDQCACKIKQRLKAERKEIDAYWLPLLEQMRDEERKKQSRISYEIDDKIELLGDRDSEIEDYLSEEYEDMHEGMCMSNKEEKLIPKRVSYEVHKFCPGSLDTSYLLQVFGNPPSITLK